MNDGISKKNFVQSSIRSWGFVLWVPVAAVMISSCATDGAHEATPVDREKIRGVIASQARPIQVCYENAIDVRPGAEGKVVVDFDINDSGAVQSFKFKEIDPRVVDVQDCMREVFSRMKFEPAPKGEVVNVAYPFFFSEKMPAKFNERAGKLQPFAPGQPKPTPTQAN